MKIYIILGILLIISSILEVFSQFKYKKTLYYSLLLIIFIIFGGRGYVGWDWVNYEPDYYLDKSRFEIGYSFFSYLIKKIGGNFSFFIGINTFISCLLIGYIFPKYTDYPIFSLFLYLSIHGLALEVDILRNAKSILLFLLSLKFLKEKKLNIYLLINGIGVTFHATSLLYIPLYFILDREIKKRWLILFFSLGIVYYFSNYTLWIDLIKDVPIPRVQGYSRVIPEAAIRGINIFFLERIYLIFLIFLGDSYIEIKKHKYYNIFKNSVFIGVLIYLFFSELSIFALRIMLLFTYAYWFFIPIILQGLKRKGKVIIFVLGICIGVYRSYNFLSFPANKIMYMYENILFGKSNFQERKAVLKSLLKYRDDVGTRELLLQY